MKNNLEYEERLQIIENMIGQARSNFVGNGYSWLVPGSLIIAASLTTYFLIEAKYHNVFLGWNIFGFLALLVLVYEIFRPKGKKVVTYIDRLFKYITLGFAICIAIIIFSLNMGVSANYGFGYFLMLYAFLMLIQGGAMKFKALLFGAGVNWIAALAIFANTVFKYDMLITAAAVFIGYIIPGIIIVKRQYQKNKIVRMTPTHHEL